MILGNNLPQCCLGDDGTFGDDHITPYYVGPKIQNFSQIWDKWEFYHLPYSFVEWDLPEYFAMEILNCYRNKAQETRLALVHLSREFHITELL